MENLRKAEEAEDWSAGYTYKNIISVFDITDTACRM